MTFEEVRSLLSTKILRGMRSMHLHLLGNLSSIRLALFTIRPLGARLLDVSLFGGPEVI